MQRLSSLVVGRAHGRWRGLLVGVVLAASAAVAPSSAAAACPAANPSYNGPCGPEFVTPAWGDAAGWNDPSQYSTIQLADVNGDGKQELIGRGADGLEIWEFDTTLGQWRPQVDANGRPQVLTDFRSPRPGQSGPNWDQPQYYSTIQAASLDGGPAEEILARFPDGMRVYKYFPPAGTNNIDGGTWKLVSQGGPFSDADGWTDPSLYKTITTADVDGVQSGDPNQPLDPAARGPADLISRTHTGAAIYRWTGSGWTPDGPQLTDSLLGADCEDVACSGDFQPFTPLGPNYAFLLTRLQYGDPTQAGVQTWLRKPPGSGPWARAQQQASGPNDPAAGPFQTYLPWPDCPGNGSDCMGQSPAYYETLQAANVDGTPGEELLGRLQDGLRMKQYHLPTTTHDDAGLNYTNSPWTHATGVPGAIDGTESSTTNGDLNFAAFGGATAVRVIGPVGPGLGTLDVSLGTSSDVYVSQNAPRRREQQVLFQSFNLHGSNGSSVMNLSGLGNGPITIDAIQTFNPTTATWSSLPTLTDLAGSAADWASTPGRWASIRTGDILGNGRDQVLALDKQGLEAWSYTPTGSTTGAWTKLQPTTPLSLTGQWLTNPSYYSTIQVGDITGTGHDAVIARGPYGIRTWFYDRRGTGGWESYFPSGYQPFSTGGEQAAFAQLNSLAHDHGVIPLTDNTVRDVWSGENAPAQSDLTQLQQGILSLANCSGRNPGSPPSFASCAPPAGSSGFTAADWTGVVNETLSEIFYAQQVLAQFSQLDQLRQQMFISEGAQLPAIAGDLQLAGAAGNTADFNMLSYFSNAISIAGSIIGSAFPEAGTALFVASSLLSMIPSASPTAQDTFQTTYAGLQDKFATMIGEMNKALAVQSQEVRANPGLLALVGQLRSRGTWSMDSIGVGSVANQAFAEWVYQALLPTMTTRYVVTSCTNWYYGTCTGPANGPSVIGGGQNFTEIGNPPSGSLLRDGKPCVEVSSAATECDYTSVALSGDVANRVWGQLSPSCSYQPGNPNTVWTFGCSVGVDPTASIGADAAANGWMWSTQTGNPVIYPSNSSVTGRVPIGRTGGDVRFGEQITLPRQMTLAGAKVVAARLLFDPTAHRELVRLPRGAHNTLTLGGSHPGRFELPGPGQSSLRLDLSKPRQRGASPLTLRMSNVRIPTAPRACLALPAGTALATKPFELQTQLQLRSGRQERAITIPSLWRCHRSRNQNVDALVAVTPKPPIARAGLRIAIRGPRKALAGRTVRYRVILRNTRTRPRNRILSSLWHVRVLAGSGPFGTYRRQITELRRGRVRTLSVRIRIPSRRLHRFCFTATAGADSAREAQARICTHLAVATPPPAGLG